MYLIRSRIIKLVTCSHALPIPIKLIKTDQEVDSRFSSASLIISHCSGARESRVTLHNVFQTVQVLEHFQGVITNSTPFALTSSPGWMINCLFSLVGRGLEASLPVIYSLWLAFWSLGRTGICITACLVVKHKYRDSQHHTKLKVYLFFHHL